MSNSNDHGGVFVLKHMETYHGETDEKWEGGLKKDNVNTNF